MAARYDWILLDCPPTLGVLTVAALSAADEVLIPLQCETLSHRGVGQLLDTVFDVRRFTNPRLKIRGVLPTLYDGRTKHARAVLDTIADAYDVTVLTAAVPRSIRFAEAPATGRSILRTAARRRAPGRIASWRPASTGRGRRDLYDEAGEYASRTAPPTTRTYRRRGRRRHRHGARLVRLFRAAAAIRRRAELPNAGPDTVGGHAKPSPSAGVTQVTTPTTSRARTQGARGGTAVPAGQRARQSASSSTSAGSGSCW